jgi:hypothetical protein
MNQDGMIAKQAQAQTDPRVAEDDTVMGSSYMDGTFQAQSPVQNGTSSSTVRLPGSLLDGGLNFFAGPQSTRTGSVYETDSNTDYHPYGASNSTSTTYSSNPGYQFDNVSTFALAPYGTNSFNQCNGLSGFAEGPYDFMPGSQDTVSSFPYNSYTSIAGPPEHAGDLSFAQESYNLTTGLSQNGASSFPYNSYDSMAEPQHVGNLSFAQESYGFTPGLSQHSGSSYPYNSYDSMAEPQFDAAVPVGAVPVANQLNAASSVPIGWSGSSPDIVQRYASSSGGGYSMTPNTAAQMTGTNSGLVRADSVMNTQIEQPRFVDLREHFAQIGTLAIVVCKHCGTELPFKLPGQREFDMVQHMETCVSFGTYSLRIIQ